MKQYYQQIISSSQAITTQISKDTFEHLLLDYRKSTIGGEVVDNQTIDDNDVSITIRGNDGYYYMYYTIDTPQRKRFVLARARHINGEFEMFEKLFSQEMKK